MNRKDDTILQITIDSNKRYNEDQVIDLIDNKLNSLITDGAIKGPLEDVLLGYDTDVIDQGYIYVSLEPDSLLDGAKLTSVGATLVNNQPESDLTRTYSVASIAEKMKLINSSPTSQMKAIVSDYTKFFKQNESALRNNTSKLNDFLGLFVNDMMGLFNILMPELKGGGDLSSMLGIKSISPSLLNVSRELSQAYRKALSSEESSGALSASVLGSLKDLYSQFMNELIMTLFFDENTEVANLSDKRRIPFSL